jgi:hypothetical protein
VTIFGGGTKPKVQLLRGEINVFYPPFTPDKETI